MTDFTEFLFYAVVVSLSGVMAPGAVTAATIAQGTRSPYAGTLISIGHGIVEIPLIFLLMLGLGVILDGSLAKVLIGLVGGAFLVWMAVQMFRGIGRAGGDTAGLYTAKPVVTGIILSAANPYFLLWWATVGLKLAMDARQFGGALTLLVFAVVHWSCDFVWLSVLSVTAFMGTKILTSCSQKVILAVCGSSLLLFGVKFIYDAAHSLITSTM